MSNQTAAPTFAGLEAPSQADVDILTAAIQLERKAQAAYAAGAKSGLLDQATVDLATKIAAQHAEHEKADTAALQKMGGTVPAAPSDFGFPAFKTGEDILKYALSLEETAANTYFDSIKKLQDKSLVQAVISIQNAEATHVALLRSALKMDPSPVSFLPFAASQG
jgi:rubrerythrin